MVDPTEDPGDRPDPILATIDAQERDDCPVRAVGSTDGVYWFLSPSGELRRMVRSDFTAIGLLSLFEGRDAWLIANHVRHDKDGEPVNDFNAKKAAADLMTRCHRIGLYDPSLGRRGLGVWKAPDGSPIVHCGDAVYVAGGWRRPGLRLDPGLYVARPRCARPDFDEPASAEDAQRMRDAIDLWRFGEPVDADMVFGWYALALLGEMPPWRVHMQCDAEHGSGKTALIVLLGAGLGPQSETLNDYTEAGIRASLTNQSRAILLDEAEVAPGGGGASRMQMVIGLIRRMSGAQGAEVARGSPNQEAMRNHVSGSAFLAGINPPPLLPQDRSRIYGFRLVKATRDPDAEAKLTAATEGARGMSPRLRARAIKQWPVFEASAPVWRRALIEAGCDGRQADMFAALLAGRDLLLHDGPPDPDSVAAEMERLGGIISELSQADEEDGDAAQCWNHLLGQPADPYKARKRITLGAMVAAAAKDLTSPYRDELRAYGMRLEPEKREDGSERPVLLVANNHQAVKRIYAGTRWEGGGHRISLLRLGSPVRGPDWVARPSGRAWQFGGPKSHAVVIPWTLLPEYEPMTRGSGPDLDGDD
ncbi:hypothetical protein FFK22_008865 [Mycobacterium sp. KBS0706]|uniref:hypothetical protein n=1 Tax=Mycobacterium sp. KBS0706 TaxID=2578109 RepID=UPI00110FD481|nr:hypothetical protein [Mycobacterium sp. KBS0706]TSD89082.1 hypothetical protein FFK22_008865 [Mycobacterium sp. KBS0706]